MKTIHSILSLAFALALILQGCGTPKLTRRYKSASYHKYSIDSISTLVKVYGSVFDIENAKPTEKDVTSLSDRGQFKYLEALSLKEPTSDGFISKASKTLTEPKKEASSINQTKFSKRIVLSVKKISQVESDRIAHIDIAVNLADQANIRIVAFDKITTKYETVDAGKLNNTSVTNFGLTGNLGINSKTTGVNTSTIDPASNGGKGSSNSSTNETSGGYGLTGNASQSNTFAEEVYLKPRYVVVSGYTTPTSLHVYQETVSGIDLTGNVFADVTFEYVDNNASIIFFNFSNLINAKKVVVPKDIVVSPQFVTYPNVTADVNLKYTYSATVRKTIKGDNTKPEYDDEIILYNGDATAVGTGEESKTILLLRKDDVVAKKWLIKDSANTLNIKGMGTDGTLLFSSREKAQEFLYWLKKSAPQIADGKISDNDYQLILNGGGAVSTTFIGNCYVSLQ